MIDYSPTGLEAASIMFAIISVLSVCLRFWSRVVNPGISIWYDDWFVLISLFPTLAVLSICIWGAQNSMGKHASDITAEELSSTLKAYMVSIVCFDVALAFGKLSALAFFVRVFGWRRNPSRWWKIAVSIGLFLTVSHTLTDPPVSITMCHPVRKYWDQDAPGYCTSQVLNFAVMTCYSIFTDIYLLILPMPLIIKLRIKRYKKLLVAITFAIGYVVPVVSIGRMVTAAYVGNGMTTDFTYTFVPVAYWCIAEPSVLILAVSLHALFQLARRGWTFGPQALFSTRDYSQIDSNRTATSETRCDSSNRLNRHVSSETYLTRSRTESKTGVTKTPQVREQDAEENVGMPTESIFIKKDAIVNCDLR